MNSLDTLFEWLLAATLRASVLAVVILGIQLILRHRLPAAWRHALWMPVLAVLVLPVLPEVPFALFPRKSSAPAPVAETLVIPGQRPLQTDTAAVITVVETTPPQTEIAVPSTSDISTGWNPYAIAWLAGAIGFMAVGIIGHRRNLRRIQLCATAPDRNLQAAIDAAAHEASLKRTPQALVSPTVASPAVTGFVRPLLLLPARFPEGFTAAEARLILLHEFSHVKRLDLPLNWLICVLQALHWFNPLLWLSFARMRADREAACDARVLAIDAADHRAEYGGALLKLQSVTPSRALSLGFIGIFERGSEIKARIRAISVHRPGNLVWQLVGGGILTLLMLFGVTKAQQNTPPTAATESASENDPALPINDAAKKAILEKLKSIIISRIDFKNATLEEAAGLKKKYDGLRDQVIAATQFVAHPMNDETREFLESVRGTWTVLDREEPDPVFSEISSVTGIPNTVDGVVEFHTHTIPPYSLIDFAQNKKESLIAAAMAIALPTSMDGRVYHGEGICFVKVNESLVEVFEDSEKGLSRALYMKAKSGEQGAAELPATAGDSTTLVPEGAILENIHGPIREIHGPSADGTVSLTIGNYSRVFAIHPDFSPDSKVLEEFARQVVNTDKVIDATVWVRDPKLTKANPRGNSIPGPPWVIIRLAETKDGP